MAVLLEYLLDEIIFVDVLVSCGHLCVVDRNDSVVVDFDDRREVVILASISVDHIGHETSRNLAVV
jgi:hypothetical protein